MLAYSSTTNMFSGFQPLFENKNIFIAGASSSIGVEVSKLFCGFHSNCILHFHKNSSVLESIFNEDGLDSGYITPTLFQADLSHGAESRTKLEALLSEHPPLDALIICVGNAIDKSFFFYGEKDVEHSLRQNLMPVINLCEFILPIMKENKKGNVVVVSSITGEVGQPMRALYGAAKSAVHSYLKSVAREYAPHNVRINYLTPQIFSGGLSDEMKERVKKVLIENTPASRLCEPTDVLGPLLMLASPMAQYMVGTGVNISGGLVTWS